MIKYYYLAKEKLNTIEVIISKDLFDSYSNHDEFVSVNQLFKEYEYMKEAIKYPKTFNLENEYAGYIQALR